MQIGIYSFFAVKMFLMLHAAYIYIELLCCETDFTHHVFVALRAMLFCSKFSAAYYFECFTHRLLNRKYRRD